MKNTPPLADRHRSSKHLEDWHWFACHSGAEAAIGVLGLPGQRFFGLEDLGICVCSNAAVTR